MLRIYHNPRCSKSRAALALLQEAGHEPEIVKYLDDPPGEETLRHLLGKLDAPAAELLRHNEPQSKALGLADHGILNEQADRPERRSGAPPRSGGVRPSAGRKPVVPVGRCPSAGGCIPSLRWGPCASPRTGIDALIAAPKLLQRPMIETDDRAYIARPPERVTELNE